MGALQVTRQSTLPLLCIVGLLVGWACRGAGAAEEGKEAPNILFAISDDQSWMHCGAYGDTATKTPAFDRIAKEGALFNFAFAASPSCAPSRSAILTGRPIWQLEDGGVLVGTLRSKFTVFTHLLEDAGYQTAATGKAWGPGRIEESWERPLFQSMHNKREDKRPAPGLSPVAYASNFEAFMASRDRAKPFFFWYGASEPHQNYDIGAWKRAGKRLEDARLPGGLPDSPATRGEILDYGLEIEHFDRHLARMIALLEDAGELDNTIVVVTSDHGNPLPRSKCNLYDSGVRVPLAIRFPSRISGGRVVDDFVSLTDLAPTILEAAGLEPIAEMTGRSLWRVLRSDESERMKRDFVVTAFERHTICRRDGVGYPMRSIRTREWSYIRNYEPERWPAGDPDFYAQPQGFFGDVDRGESKRFMMRNEHDAGVRPYYLRAFGRRPAEELYDMKTDPDQLHNLADDPEYDAIKTELAAKLEEYLRKHDDPRIRGENPWDAYEYTNPSAFANPNWRTEGMASPIR